MPVTAAFIDDMRAAFGADLVNAAIKGGMAGEGQFYARENGIEFGGRPHPCDGVAINGNDMAPAFASKGKK